MSENQSLILDYDINYFNVLWYWFKFNRDIKSGRANSKTYLYLSLVYSGLNLNRKAFVCALKAIRMDRTSAYAWYAAGAIRAEMTGDRVKSEKYFLKSYELGGEDFYPALYELICCAARECNSIMYMKYENKFMEIKSTDSGYLLRRGFVHISHERFKPAVHDYFLSIRARIFNHRASDPDPGSFFTFIYEFVPSTINHIRYPWMYDVREAFILLECGHETEGVDLWLTTAGKARKLEDKEIYYKSLLDYFYDKEEYKKCIDAANRILIKYRYSEAYGYKAACYRELGEFEKAREVLHQAHELGHKDFTTSRYYQCLARTYFCEGEYGKAISWLNKQIITEPSSHPFFYKGFCLEELNEFDGAIKAYNKSLEYEADDLTYYRVANLYYIKNDYENALKSINQSLLLKKDSFNYNLKGDILTAMKRIKEARFCYKLADGLE